MYIRYFMWNFVGRQDDIQGNYTILHGNWISGIPFIDEIRLGSQSKISDDARNNKARNTYYFLPFILGLMGLIFLYQQDKNVFGCFTLFPLYGLGSKNLPQRTSFRAARARLCPGRLIRCLCHLDWYGCILFRY